MRLDDARARVAPSRIGPARAAPSRARSPRRIAPTATRSSVRAPPGSTRPGRTEDPILRLRRASRRKLLLHDSRVPDASELLRQADRSTQRPGHMADRVVSAVVQDCILPHRVASVRLHQAGGLPPDQDHLIEDPRRLWRCQRDDGALCGQPVALLGRVHHAVVRQGGVGPRVPPVPSSRGTSHRRRQGIRPIGTPSASSRRRRCDGSGGPPRSPGRDSRSSFEAAWRACTGGAGACRQGGHEQYGEQGSGH